METDIQNRETDMAPVNILIVDDKPANLLSMKELLQSPGYRLVTAGSGIQALKRLLDTDFAVVLLDVQMPDMDGFETAKLIWSRPKNRETPIIFVTAVWKNDAYMKKGYSLGAVDYLYKPIVPAFLKAKVRVFVALYRKTEEIKRQNEIRKKELETALAGMREMAEGRPDADGPSRLKALGPLHEREPEIFAALQKEYQDLLEAYLDAKVTGNAMPRRRTGELALRIGNLKGGPRDVVDLHLRAVAVKTGNENQARVRAFTLEGRLFSLEVMGRLVDYYRLKQG